MTGTHPTVGCLIVQNKTSFSSIEEVMQTLQSLLPITDWRRSEAGPSSGGAPLGGSRHEMIVMAQEVGELVFIHLEFDEENVVRLSSATGIPVEQLFMPYVQAAKTLPGVVAVGMGFELSPPQDFGEQSLREAGLAVFFARDESHKTWFRRDLLPMAGHPPSASLAAV